MKSSHVMDRLSAYIDGKAGDMERITLHLQQCGACAKRHMQLATLSAHLKAMPAPEIHPAFVTRVVAGVAAAPQAAPRSRWAIWLPLAAVAAIITVVIAAELIQPPAPGNRNIGERIAGVESVDGTQNIDEGALLQKIEDRVADGEYTAALDFDETGPDLAASDSRLAEIADSIDQVANLNVSDEGFAGTGITVPAMDSGDIGLSTLNDSEAQAFVELLSEYARKG